MRISNDCVALVKHFEGLRLRAYTCPAGRATIGYGHTATVTGADVAAGWSITEVEAERLLRQDLEAAALAVGRNVTSPLEQRQFDALVSFVHNLGEGSLGKSALRRRLNAGDAAAAAEQLLRKARVEGQIRVLPGLTRRRQAEQALFLGQDWKRFCV